eukprot:GHVT01019405.1.p1 GENE.GHVT01019405.1~~GHVT01019405.1.p1  ORF type:complete len:234 (+),score=25.96 GHVT01019405.1:391-1092(+)
MWYILPSSLVHHFGLFADIPSNKHSDGHSTRQPSSDNEEDKERATRPSTDVGEKTEKAKATHGEAHAGVNWGEQPQASNADNSSGGDPIWDGEPTEAEENNEAQPWEASGSPLWELAKRHIDTIVSSVEAASLTTGSYSQDEPAIWEHNGRARAENVPVVDQEQVAEEYIDPDRVPPTDLTKLLVDIIGALIEPRPYEDAFGTEKDDLHGDTDIADGAAERTGTKQQRHHAPS